MSALAIEGVPAGEPVFAATEVGRRFGDADALERVSLAIAPGEHVVVIGASGAGKSLLLRIALGLERASTGRMTLLGEEIAALRGADRRRLLARIGVLFASDALFEDLSVEENVALGVRGRRSREAVYRAAREALLLVGVKHREHSRPGVLTAGEHRRVALARAIAGGPKLLLVDEPARGLDPVAAGAIHLLLAQLRERLELTLLVTSADPRSLDRADRAGFLHGGRLSELEAPDQLRAEAGTALQQLLAGRPYGPIAP